MSESKLIFTPDLLNHGLAHPTREGMFYLSATAIESGGVGDDYAGSISGYVTRRALGLVMAAPALLDLARKYASECADCGGTGTVNVRAWPECRQEPCDACADIRAVIANAQGEAAP